MINCYIIAEIPIVEKLEKHIGRFPLTILEGYTAIDSFITPITMENPGIFFIDVNILQNHKKKIMNIGRDHAIVLLADSKEYAYEAFEFGALDYILKPIGYELFEKCINKFINFSLLASPRLSQRRLGPEKAELITDSFFIKSDFRGQKEILIKCDEVIFIEAKQNYVVVRTHDREYICHNTLKEMEENLPPRLFIRVHKSFIINYDKITSVEGNVIQLNENEKFKIQIGSTYKKAFFERKSRKIIRKKNLFDLNTYSKYGMLFMCLNPMIEIICLAV